MRRNVRIITLILFCLLLTSCVDYVQAISYKNGTYQLYYKFTLSKVLFAMMDQAPEEIFGEINSDTEENLPNNARTRIINTDLEVGEEFYFEVNPKTTDDTEKFFYLRLQVRNVIFLSFWELMILLKMKQSPQILNLKQWHRHFFLHQNVG